MRAFLFLRYTKGVEMKRFLLLSFLIFLIAIVTPCFSSPTGLGIYNDLGGGDIYNFGENLSIADVIGTELTISLSEDAVDDINASSGLFAVGITFREPIPPTEWVLFNKGTLKINGAESFNAIDQGNFSQFGLHDSTDQTALIGLVDNVDYNSFFLFDLRTLGAVASSVELVLGIQNIQSPISALAFDVYDVSTSPEYFNQSYFKTCTCDLEPAKRDGDIDGSDLAIYAEGGTGINLAVFAFNLGRTDCPIQLTTEPGREVSPSWSPNNTKIAFASEKSGAMNIWKMDTNGDNWEQLTDNDDYNTQPHWRTDSAKIAFNSDMSGNFDIWMMDADGSNQEQQTTYPAGDYLPDFSPDGSRIIFQTVRQGNSDIWIMDSDGKKQTPITNSPNYEGWPHFCSDGSKIVYRCDISGNYDICVINSDGSNPIQLTNTPENEGHPHFSPDCSKIAFWSQRTGNLEVWIMNADGSNQTQITDNPASDGAAYWSPDGKKLVFRSNRAGNDDIWIYNLDN